MQQIEGTSNKVSVDIVRRVRGLVLRRIEGVCSCLVTKQQIGQLMPGKMLRTRLAARLAGLGSLYASGATIELTCAAVELVHAASLCHDDVIDNSLMRRGQPTLWSATGRSGAVLVGDLLLCEAMDLLLDLEDGRYLGAFVEKVREVCAAEAEHELKFRGKQLDQQTCVRLARGKTGPLFAFVGYVCGGKNNALSRALEEAGYRIGTAYQLADDLLDLIGNEGVSRKTLGTDLKRHKFTLAQLPRKGQSLVKEQITGLCASALDCLAAWPGMRDALVEFLEFDLQPVFGLYGISLDEDVRSAHEVQGRLQRLAQGQTVRQG